MTRPLLYVFSPLTPARNGIADYTHKLLGALESYYTCIGVVADDAPEPDWQKAIYLSEYRRISSHSASERHLFQLGNNAGHAYMIPWLEQVPGVVTLHDATMAHAMDWITSNGGGGRAAYLRLADAAHGQKGRILLEQAVDGGMWFGGLGQELSFLPPLIQQARAVVVHSGTARQRVAAAAPRVRTHLIPHFAEQNKELLSTAGDGELRLLCLGFPSRAKRLDLVLDALVILRAEGIPARLTIAGEVRPEEVDIEAAIAVRQLEPLVEITGYVSEQRMTELFGRTDVVVNLRDPTSGESSGSLARAMAAGICAIVTDVGTYAEYPDDIVVKIAKSMMNASSLAQTLWRLRNEPVRRKGIGLRGQEFVLQTCSLDRVAVAYRDAIEAAYTGSESCVRWQNYVDFPPPTHTAAFEILALQFGSQNRDHQLFWRERLLPLKQLKEERPLFAIGVDMQSKAVIERGFGWKVQEPTGTEIITSALVLMDESNTAALAELMETAVNMAERLLYGGTLTIDVVNESYLRNTLCGKLERLGLRIMREARGPTVPLLSVRFQHWLPSSWAAIFVRCAATLDAA
jgi:glycosyltransferase involved in cell wall biosynthesis